MFLTLLAHTQPRTSDGTADAHQEELDPKVNAIVARDEEGARAAALEADRTVSRGEPLGRLHGVPVTIKDSLEVAGMRTTGGSARWGMHVSTSDAESVARLKNDGAIVFGKSNMPPDARDWQTYNDVYGTTNNPWDPTRGPGGSSGGSAAALAAGLTGLALGGDSAGSIRVPAHFCDVYGLRTSSGIVPRYGSVSGHAPGTLADFDVAVLGPLGRHADNLALGLDILAGATTTAPRLGGWSCPPPGRPLCGAFGSRHGSKTRSAPSTASWPRSCRRRWKRCGPRVPSWSRARDRSGSKKRWLSMNRC
ncbi:amidase family protein [Streptomyces sp. NPDC002122]|uniref:amidase family protein n=1 Tax=Streptomyces sp. NPDC002122 TaxID=3154407 RepID=UPI00333174E3